MKTVFFRGQSHFRAWLAKNHASSMELWVGFYNKKSGRMGITYPQALDEALCFGWIDGVRKSVDGQRYHIRFTPRKKKSYWSLVNIKRYKQLKKLGEIKPAGAKAYETAVPTLAARYSYERKTTRLDRESKKQLQGRKKAWQFFAAQAPYYVRVATWWVVSAKKEETRTRRLAALIEASAKGQRLGQFLSKAKKV